MTRLLLFDTDTDAVGVVEVISQFSAMEGVESFEVLESSSSPRFCLLVETDNAADAAVAAHVEALVENYADYVRNVTHLSFRKVSEWEDAGT
jgi:hypothetical protein